MTANQDSNRRFYTEIMGLRRVKQTVNQDDIHHRHLFYADERGTTGGAITFFEWPNLPSGFPGLTSPHHLAYGVSSVEVLMKWKAWLLSLMVPVTGPLARAHELSLYFRDMDGVILEIIASNAERISDDHLDELSKELPDVRSMSRDMKLTTFHHVSPLTREAELTRKFFDKFLGLKKTSTRRNPDQVRAPIIAIGNDDKPDFLRYLAYPGASDGLVGTGSVHHIALAVESEDDQLTLMRHLNDAGIGNSGIIDRLWFKSLYFRDPDNNLLEIATKGPGYTADEPMNKLGTSLMLPPWLEPRRGEIEARLKEVDDRNVSKWPPSYPQLPTPPERIRKMTTND